MVMLPESQGAEIVDASADGVLVSTLPLERVTGPHLTLDAVPVSKKSTIELSGCL